MVKNIEIEKSLPPPKILYTVIQIKLLIRSGLNRVIYSNHQKLDFYRTPRHKLIILPIS